MRWPLDDAMSETDRAAQAAFVRILVWSLHSAATHAPFRWHALSAVCGGVMWTGAVVVMASDRVHRTRG
jgi:hypothetical protein